MNLFDPREHFGEWGAAPLVYVDDVMRRWSVILSREAPWSAMPCDDVRGVMRSVVSELMNDARDLDDTTRRQRLAVAAREHGAFRAGQGCSEEQVTEEFEYVLLAIEGALRGVGVNAHAAETAVAALDADFWLSERAALRAWHRAVVSRSDRRRWLDVLLEELG